MNDLELIGLDDVFSDGQGSRTAARWVAGGLGVVFFLLSAATTAAFFMTFAPGLGSMAGPVAGPYLAAVMGVLTLDLAALSWGYVRAHGTDSQGQQVLAAIVGGVDLVMSLVVSGLYVLLAGSTLDAGVVDASGALTDFGHSLHLAGVVIVTAGLVINFAAVWLFSALAASTRAAAQRSELAAAQREAQFRVATMHTRATAQRTISAIAEQLPGVAASTAEANARRYVDAYTVREGQGQAERVNGHRPT